jgi:GAF domain-containing protein
VDPEVSDALLRRSLTGDPEAGAALPPETRGRRLELVIARLSAVSSMRELDELMPLVAQELNAAEAYVSDSNREAGYVESLTGPRTGNRYWLADYPSTAHALHAQEAVQVLADETEADGAEVALLRANGNRSLLMVPIIHRGVSTGLLEAVSPSGTPWSRTAINQARIIAYHLGAVLATLDRDQSGLISGMIEPIAPARSAQH